MQMSGNTVLITGGGSGIGRGLAEALQKAGNQVVIAGRRRSVLEETVSAHQLPNGGGMQFVELNVEDPASIAEVAAQVVKEYPALNVLINNAGIMRATSAGAGTIDDEDLVSTVTTNLLGPIRLTQALLPHLKEQKSAVVMNVTSGLAFVPMAAVSVYCATKAALHSYTQSLRFDLRGTGVKVIELVPPYVQTELFRGANDPRAMPLAEYIAEAVELLGTDAEEIVVERARFHRPEETAAQEAAKVKGYNEMLTADPH